MLRPPTPTPINDPVSAVLTDNRDLVHEILKRVPGGFSARDRAAVRTLGPAFADAADRLPVSVDASDPTSWALARHSTDCEVANALRGLVSLRCGGADRPSTLAAARLLRAAALPSLASVSAAHLGTPWLARGLEGRQHALQTLSASGFWHRPASAGRLPACGARRLVLTQLPGGGVGAGKAALLPHARLLGRVASVHALTLVGLAGAVLEVAPPDLRELSLEGVPVSLVERGRAAAPPVSLPPHHGRLARLSLGFEACDSSRAPSRPAVVDLLGVGGVAEAVALTAPGRAVRVRVPSRFLPAGGDGGDATAVASALQSALVASGVGSVEVESEGWEAVVVAGDVGGEGGGEGGVVEAAPLPGPAILAAGVGRATPSGGWAWSAGRR